MPPKLFFFLLALTSCRQACGLELATSDGGSAQGGGGSAQGGGGSIQGGGGSTQGGGGSGSTVTSAAGGQGGIGGSQVVCDDFGPPAASGAGGGGGGGSACAGELIDTIECPAGTQAQLSFDCSSQEACPFPSNLGSSLGGSLTVSDGVLEMLPEDSGFYSGEPSLFVFSAVAESFLAVTLVQPNRRNDAAGWPASAVNLAGLVARAESCDSASECGLWTKFELGTTPTGNRGWVFASSIDGIEDNIPDPFNTADFAVQPSCPPAILVGLCGIRDGDAVTVGGFYGFPDGTNPAVVTPNPHSWTLPVGDTSIEVGMVAASGFGPATNDLQARFGMFHVHTGMADAAACVATFNDLLAQLQAP